MPLFAELERFYNQKSNFDISNIYLDVDHDSLTRREPRSEECAGLRSVWEELWPRRPFGGGKRIWVEWRQSSLVQVEKIRPTIAEQITYIGSNSEGIGTTGRGGTSEAKLLPECKADTGQRGTQGPRPGDYCYKFISRKRAK